jgi:hypothetical protein
VYQLARPSSSPHRNVALSQRPLQLETFDATTLQMYN